MQGRRIAVFVVIAAALAGCTSTTSGDPTTAPTSNHRVLSSSAPTTPQPRSSTPASPSPTVPTTGPNVRPGEKQPTLPRIGLTNTNAGQIAFATYWMRSLDWSYATTSSGLSRQLFSATCASCKRLLTFDIDDVAKLNRHYLGGRIGVIGTRIRPNDKHFDSTAVVDVTVRQSAFRLVGASGKVYERTPAASATFRTWLERQGASWTVVDWKTVRAR